MYGAQKASRDLRASYAATMLPRAGIAAYFANLNSMSPEARKRSQAAYESGEDVRHEHRVRALEARKRKLRTAKPPRCRLPAPERTRRFCQPISMEGVLDPRLSAGASRCLVLVMSECGKYRVRLLTNGYLGNLLNRSARQVQRYISELVEYGYLICWPQRHWKTKAQIGRFIKPTAKCFPFWHADGPGNPGKPLSRWNDGHDRTVPHEISKTKQSTVECKLSTDRNPAEHPRRRESAGWAFQQDEAKYGWDPGRKRG